MKKMIMTLCLFSSFLAHAGQVKSDCSAINENRQKSSKLNLENNTQLKKSALVQ